MRKCYLCGSEQLGLSKVTTKFDGSPPSIKIGVPIPLGEVKPDAPIEERYRLVIICSDCFDKQLEKERKRRG